MSSKGGKKQEVARSVKHILITQLRPESEKSPYFELERKYKVQLAFCPFIKLEGIPAKDFRRQKIDIAFYSGIIFTSRNAIDHFFRLCEEMKIAVSQETKYFCITEAVALYLQKFILYRKRKVFFGADGSNKSLFDVINKHKANEIGRALEFMRSAGINPEEFKTVDFYSSHEALILEYEKALTRIDSRTGNAYDVSAHFVWIGERTRQLDGAHIDFAKKIKNPIGVKLGPKTTAQSALEIINLVNSILQK